MLLHLGVNDIPYVQTPMVRVNAHRNRPRGVKAGEQTTGDVAGWLENRYHVMEVFWELHQPEIVESLEQSMADQLTALFTGAPPSNNPFAAAETKIEELFRDFLSLEEMNTLGIPGVPTEAALEGVNHRLKIRHGSPRPSFIDTGLYQANMRAWFEGQSE